MSCPKCAGLQITERSYDVHEGHGTGWLVMTKCVNCGTYEDDLIQFNRRISNSGWPVIKRGIPRVMSRPF